MSYTFLLGAGGVLGGKLIGNRAIGYVEREPYRCRTLSQRIADGILDDAPVYCGTVREFIDAGCAAAYSGLVDVLCAGFPCPPFSLAGKRLGANDPRNGWPETIDAIRIIRPAIAFLENVPGLITHPYFKTICGDLQGLGYRLRATVIGGIDVGAPHLRKRLWMLAYTEGWQYRQHTNGQRKPQERRVESQSGSETVPIPNAVRCEGRQNHEGQEPTERRRVEEAVIPDTAQRGRPELRGTQGQTGHADGLHETVADAKSQQCGTGLCQDGQERNGTQPANGGCAGRINWWDAEPGVGRVADGMAYRVDRLEALGDGQIPAVVKLAWETLTADL